MTWTYLRPGARGPLTLELLLSAATIDDAGCRLWSRYIDRKGYGRISVDSKDWRVHRLAYTLANGVIPDGLTVDHMCFNRSCIEPSHLQLLTAEENLRRQQSALAPTCTKGHPRTADNWVSKKRNGRDHFYCRECRRLGD